MCGIIAYAGTRKAAPIILNGLAALEYRGYDSAGLAILDANGIPSIHKKSGKLANLSSALIDSLPDGITGIGHTRWATHGEPTDTNAHPHTDCNNHIIVVHNGIVENYVELKEKLSSQGHIFKSQTDTECIPHLIESHIDRGLPLEEALRSAATEIKGANAVVAISTQEPGKLVGFRLGNAGGLVIGYGNGESLLASDLPAIIPHTQEIAYLAGGELVSLCNESIRYSSLDGSPITKSSLHVNYDPLSTTKGKHKHFMHKEMHEQPEAILNSLRGRVSFDEFTVTAGEAQLSDQEISRINRVVLVGMGTSFNAAMVARNWIEKLAHIPCEYDNSSEFRYRDPIIDQNTLVISLSQSGETADTLAAMEEAQKKGALQITLCNYPGTQTTRIAEHTMLLRAGLEIGVASTKTFLCSLISLYLLAIDIGARNGSLGLTAQEGLVKELARLPELVGLTLADENQYETLALKYGTHNDFLYLGRGINFPIAMEGALKLKEISYIHAEGYPAAEMKHGPISLIDDEMPVVALIPDDDLYEKMLSNINEVKTRGGRVIAIATSGDTNTADQVDDIIYIPKASDLVNPILLAPPVQLLAYHIALSRGCDVDQPRNLAKSVTVE